MPENRYPVFVEGQTLTEAELNQLRNFLHDRDRALGRLIGFGVNCGLTGEVAAGTLQIAAGMAIDQEGEPLLLPTDQSITLPPTPDGTFNFVDPAPAGFTVVLVATDTEETSPECGEEGCEGHAEPHLRQAELQVVAGRLTGPRFDFSSEPLLAASPLRLSVTSNPSGSFVGLRDAILGRIGSKLAPAIAAKLGALRIETSDLPVVKAYKAAFLNEVLFAALDLLRCEALMDIACLRSTSTPGVALGWLHQVGAAWQWDCDYRHHWEPPPGLSIALRGGSCDDPCRPYLDRVEGLIDTFEVPVVPAPPDPPSGGGIDPGDYHICKPIRGGRFRLYPDECHPWFFPPYEVPIDWPDRWIEEPTFPPDPGWIDPVPPEVAYGTDILDWLETGLIDLSPAFGAGAEGVRDALSEVIAGAGIDPNVQVLTAGEVGGLDGYQPSGAVSGADVVVLTADTTGKVIATGRIPGSKAVRNAGTALPKATEAANAALEATNEFRGALGGVNDQLEAFGMQLGGLEAFQEDMISWRATAEGTLGGIGGHIETVGSRVFTEYETRLAGEIPSMVNGAIEGITAGLLERVRLEIDADLDARFEDLESTLTTGLAHTTERVAKLEGSYEVAQSQLEQTAIRIDQVYAGRSMGLADAGIAMNAAFNEGLVTMLRTMRRSIESSASATQLPKVQAELQKGAEAMARLETQARAGSLVLTDEKTTLSAVVDSMVSALGAAGASTTAMSNLRREVESFKGLMG